MDTATALRTRALKPGFGAEILDIDVARADSDTLAQVAGIFHDNGAIVLRGQAMAPDDLIRFVSAFGTPEHHTMKQYTLPGYPLVYVLSNRVEDGKQVGAHYDGLGWHTDYSYKAEPVMSTMLYCVRTPPEGGDTLLADAVAAFDALPAERQAALQKLKLHHSYLHFMATRDHHRAELTPQQRADNPDVIHPLIRTHPANGRKALWVSTGTVTEIIGQDDPKNLALLDELVDFVTQERFVYRHKWQVGDLLMWDNRCTLHTGTEFDHETHIREMHRLWVRGDRPF